jgi:DNA polymerase/3'-5' exonuclease PolX
MSNQKIVDEFQRLVAFIKEENDKLIEKKDKKGVTRNNFRIRQLSTVVSILKKFPNKISLKNLDELKEIRGIGKSSISRVEEILKDGKLSELGDFVDTKKEKKKAISELEEIVGVGHTKALEFYNQGITSVKILKKKIKKKEVEVNDKVLLGLKYHGVYKVNIPRKEITDTYKVLKKIVKKMNKKHDYPKEKQYCLEICGSYRREKPKSNDIDVLLTKFGTTDKSSKKDKHLQKFVKKLKKNIRSNNNSPLLVDDMTDKKIETKYMGFSKYKNNPVRRIDIRYIQYSSYHSALLYFTGSGDLNKKMRQIAKNKGYKLSEYGLFKLSDNSKIKIKSERDVFKILGMEYLPPRLR